MIVTPRKKKRLAAWIAAFGCGLWLLAQAAPVEAQASRTRPGGSSGGSASSSSSSGSSGGGSASSSRGSSPSRPASVQRTRPPSGSSGGAPTVVDKRRPPRSSGSSGGFHHHRSSFFPSLYWSPYRWSWWYPGWGYPGWGYPYYGYGGYGYGGYGYPYGATVYPSRVRASMGALDTDVWPAKTQVWINGQYVGFVDQFDGFPRYLWLERGTYDVVFYYEGYETLARQYTIYPGLVIDVEDRLEPGEAIHPSELAPKETPRRDARVDADRERRARADEPDWRERVRTDREAVPDRDVGAGDDQGRALDLRGAGARLYLGIRPGDAAVYLDGEFIGTGDELAAGAGDVLIDPGEHELSVVRPGYDTQRIEFEAEAGGEVELEVALESS